MKESFQLVIKTTYRRRRRRRFCIGTRQRSWTGPVEWELIPLTALWASEGGAQLS